MRRGLRTPLAIAAAVVIVDQLTKHWALNALADGHVIDIVGSLRLNLAFNKGMAFSQAEGLGPIIGVVALAVIVVMLVSVGRSTSRWYPLAVGLIIGGALGNVIDRLFRGEGWLRGGVVDFIDVQWWPIFNVADICVTVGGVLLLLTSLFAAPEPDPAPAGDAGPPAAGDRDRDASADVTPEAASAEATGPDGADAAAAADDGDPGGGGLPEEGDAAGAGAGGAGEIAGADDPAPPPVEWVER